MRLTTLARAGLWAVLAVALAVPAAAQVLTAREAWFRLGSLRLYEGDARRALEPMTFGSWGGGFAGETWGPNLYFVGPRVIQVVSQGYHSGGILHFTRPLDLRTAFEQKGWMMELRIRLVQPGASPAPFPIATGEAGAAAGTTGATTAQPGSARPKVEGVEIPTFPATKFLRIQLETPSGPLVASRVSIESPGSVDRGWVLVAFPLDDFKGLAETPDARIFRMLVSSDRPQLFYIGQIRVTRDLQPFTVTLSADPATARVGQPVRFRAQVDKGLSRTRVRWDFDASDGVTVQAEGENLVNIYRQPGEYTVTATVDDVIGAKPMETQTIRVRVQ